MPANPYDKYKEQSVMTMTHGEMLTRLYEEVIKQLNIGMLGIKEKNYNGTNEALKKAQRILNYLKATLDFKYDIANNLASLYDFFNQQIMSANIKKNSKMLEEILPMVEELKDAFVQGEKLARMSKQPPETRFG